jgi:hypothetical protein
MAKSSRKKAAKPAAKPVKGKKSQRAKPTPEALSDQQRQTLLFNHRRKLKPLLDAEAQAKAAVKKAYELAKKEGIPKQDIQLAIRLESDEGIEAAKNDLERTNRIARWLGVSKQLDLFGDKETTAQRHFEDGRRAALDDQPAKPPSHLGTKDANTWHEGHAAGRTSLNESRIRGMAPLSEAADKVVDNVSQFPAPQSVAAE